MEEEEEVEADHRDGREAEDGPLEVVAEECHRGGPRPEEDLLEEVLTTCPTTWGTR